MTVLALLGALFLIIFLGLGHFVDASDKPLKSDLIVSLGGGDGQRIKKAIQLYQQGFSLSGKFLYTGRDIVSPALPSHFSKNAYLHQHGVKKEDIIFVRRGIITNTAEELFFIKDYMLRHGYKSVLIVSTPIHTRRIKALAAYIAGYRDGGIRYTVTSYNKPGWNPTLYFLDPASRQGVFLEFEKLIYNLLKYSPFLIDETSYAKKKDSPLWKNALNNL